MTEPAAPTTEPSAPTSVASNDDAPIPQRRMSGPKALLLMVTVGGSLGLGSMALSSWMIARRNASVFAASGELDRLLARAAHAPGAEELRALGCSAAGALETDELRALTGQMVAEQIQAKGKPKRTASFGPEPTIVYCVTQARLSPPDCDAIATAYRTAAKPTAPFLVTARRQDDERCVVAFDADGSSRGPGTSPNLPAFFSR
jgi:hypothetical protein